MEKALISFQMSLAWNTLIRLRFVQPVMAILSWFQADLLCTSKTWKDHSTTHALGSTFWNLLNTHEPYCCKQWASVTQLKIWRLVLPSLPLLFLESKGFYMAISQSLYHCVQINSYFEKYKRWLFSCSPVLTCQILILSDIKLFV